MIKKFTEVNLDDVVKKTAQEVASKQASTQQTAPKQETTSVSAEPETPAADPVVEQAQAMLKQQVNQSNGNYQPTWQEQLDETMDKILNREPFQYDMNADALYQMYNDRFQTQGRKAMLDTMGQAATMTGGYGNTYAQMAGRQAYQEHLQGMGDVIPELYQLALDRYDREGDALKEKYDFLMANPETENLPVSSSSSSSGSGYDNGGLSANQIKMIQLSLGVEADGKWGPASKAAAGGLTAQQAYDAWNKGQLGKPVGAVAGMSGNSAAATAQTPAKVPTTYKEARSYLLSIGGDTANLMSPEKWKGMKANNTSAFEVQEFDTYEEYLAAYIAYQQSL